MFQIFPLLILVYVIWRLVGPQGWQRWQKYLLSFVLLLISQYYLIARTLLGSLASPEIPHAAIMVCGGLFGAFVLLAILLLLKDIVIGVGRLVQRCGILRDCRVDQARLSLILAGVALVLGAIGVWQASAVPVVREVEIRAAHLPKQWDGLRIVQLTDLHASRLFQADWMRAVVERTNAAHPDLILITGDIVDGTVENRAPDVAPLRDLHAKYGVFAALGNHEYYSDFGRWPAALSGLGLQLLINQQRVLNKDGASLVVAGVSDKVAENFGGVMPDAKQALAGKPQGAYAILMAHRPGDAEANVKLGADLQLSGHTHGGQIWGIHWLAQLANNGFVSGLYALGDASLYVSNGAGLWPGFPIRLGQTSEIALITLHSAAQ